MNNIRARAAQVLFQVVDKGVSLSAQLPKQTHGLSAQDKAQMQQMCYGVLRHLPALEYYCQQLLDSPLKGKNRVFQFLLYVGIYQLQHMRIPAHAVVTETVNALPAMKAPGLKGLINAVLRNFQRQQQELETNALQIEACRYNHPSWFTKRIKTAYPDTWQAILAANQQQAPMWLRVNQSQTSTKAYSQLLNEQNIAHSLDAQFPDAIKLDKAIDVYKLPFFTDGYCSVQDAGAQLAARLLDPQPNERILDACAAPGGKTCHILELANTAQVTALDCDETRLARVTQNLQRLNFNADLICADAAKPDTWHKGEQFDRILLDVPCSATGVIRRHPDIKWLRRDSDISELAALQQQILQAAWALLKPNGVLLYATCSVLPEENHQQVSAFLAKQSDAKLLPLPHQSAANTAGWQLLPNETDGFYYAKLQKVGQV